ncbi:MAG: methionine adenosyltransferase [Eubacteriales bacterium]|nr:methionine adenosyltransferase [Eubacteriales bacterium]
MRKLFTSESVTEGHPDKICDQISDAILDALLAQDPLSRVACETAATTGLVVVMGEITSRAVIDVAAIARQTIGDIGYDRAKYGFDYQTCGVMTSLSKQSADIAGGVDHALEERQGGGMDIGAGDQGMMFGFACDQTQTLMPMPIELAHLLARRLTAVRKGGIMPSLRPDGKTQVTVEYEGDRPLRVNTVVVSAQHAPDVTQEALHHDIIEHVIRPTIPAHLIDDETRFLINPSGRFVIGGPQGDSGLTGRKIIVDTYGGYGRHGGGAFSGKDPTKVDRSAAYAARHVAKNVVAAGLASACEIELAYAIGMARPVSISVDTFGTGNVSDDALVRGITQVFDLRPAAIIDRFGLRRPIYRPLAAYGHFGRSDLDLPWEKTDAVQQLQKAVSR